MIPDDQDDVVAPVFGGVDLNARSWEAAPLGLQGSGVAVDFTPG